jgi:hypothetical protein
MIEQRLSALTRRLLCRGDFASRDDLETQITACAGPTTERPAPTGGAMTPTPNAPATPNATLNTRAIPTPSTEPHDPHPAATGNRQRTCDALR